MNSKFDYFKNKQTSYQNPLRKISNSLLSHPKDDDYDILENYIINNTLDSKSTQKKHF